MKTKSIYLSLHLLFCALFGPVFGQPTPDFTYLSEKDPVNNTFVLSVIQAYSGHYYLATAGELFRFDGYEHRRWTYDPDDPNSLSNQVMWSLAQTPDSMIWIGTDNGLNALDPRTERITRFYHEPENPNSLPGNGIWELFVDEAGVLWIGTDNGFSRFSPSSRQFERFCYQTNQNTQKEVYAFLPAARSKEMWVGVGEDLVLFHPQSGTQFSLAIPGSGNPGEEEDYTIRCLLRDREGMVWVGTGNRGIFRFDPARKVFTDQITDEDGLRNTRIRALHQDEEGYIWVGTYGGGLHFLDPVSGTVYPFETDPFNPVHENFDVVYTIFEDPSSNIWVGTYYGGAKIVRAAQKPFQQFVHVPGKPGAIPKTGFGDFTELPDGTIMMANRKDGYLLFDPVTEIFTQHTIQLGSRKLDYTPEIRCIVRDAAGNLWGTGSRSMVVQRAGSNIWEHFLPKGLPPSGWITHQFIDPQGRHWIATQEGLYRFDAFQETLRRIALPALQRPAKVGNNQHVLSISMTRDGSLWFNTQGGANRLAPGQDSIHFYPAPASIFDTYQTVDGRFYYGSNIGLGRLDTINDTILFDLPIRETLVWAFLDDDNGRLWMSGNLSLHSFDPVSGAVHSYNEADGISVGKFFGHHLKDRDGQFYYAGNKGIMAFDPLDVKENTIVPRPVLTQIRLSNTPLPIRGSPADSANLASPLLQAPAFAKKMTLKHWQNDVSFTFAAVEITSPENNQFAYRLKPQDPDWVQTSADQRVATYTNLRPGHYTFEVKASNNDGLWSSDAVALDLHILPPWYWNPIAWVIYVLAFLWLTRWLYRRQLTIVAAREKAQYLEELNQTKDRIFTNLSHEFRTPLTNILGATRLWVNKPERWQQLAPERITNSAQELLRLVDQMLGLSRLQSQNLPLHYQQTDAVNFLAYLTEAYQYSAEQRNILLTFITAVPRFAMDVDVEKWKAVIGNLLTNALKFTPEGGRVVLEVQRATSTQFVFSVRDTGPGIPEAERPQVFDRFFQGKASASGGTGIGLAYTRELVHLLGGNITLHCPAGGGTVFRVTLPVQRKAQDTFSPSPQIGRASDTPHEFLLPPLAAPAAPERSGDEDQPSILIVEDHPQVRDYLAQLLSESYRILSAEDGLIGQALALEHIPDLILTDLMMPRQDGLTLCRFLKGDMRTNHIPIVVLTAKADDASRLSGLAKGADVYLTKPVVERELLLHLHNLLQMRNRLREKYAGIHLPGSSPADHLLASDDLNQQFLFRAKEIILSQRTNDDFDVKQFCQDMGVSRTQLHQKLKAITGIATTAFIRKVRVEYAQKLLLQTDHSVSEIAYEAGFKHPSSFNRAFREWVGCSPSDFREETGR